MKTFNIKWEIICMALILAMSLQSCSEDESFDIVGSSSNILYINTQTWSPANMPKNSYPFSVIHTPIGELGNVVAKFPIQSTKPVGNAVTIKTELIDSLVDSYNRKYGTSYSKIPQGVVNLSKSEVSIDAQKNISNDSITVSIDSAKLALLTDTKYLVPIRIVSSNASDINISSDYNTVFLEITTSFSNCYQSPVSSDMTGTLITPRTNWSATMDVAFSNAASRLFDGNTRNYIMVSPSVPCSLTVDMNTEFSNISGIRIHSYSTSYSITSAKVYSSTNGTDWNYQGSASLSTSSSYQYIKFYTQITARYLKIEITGYRSATYIVIAEFDVYRQN